MKEAPFVIFMDNLYVHKSSETRAAMAELNIKCIFNVPYSPQFNPIERGFSVVKNHYKRARLNAMRNGKPS
jgi:transposase